MDSEMTTETILVLAHTEPDGALADTAWEAVGAGHSLSAALGGAGLVIGLFGEQVEAAANSAADCGAGRFLGVTGAAFGTSRYATDAAAAEALCRAAKATLIIAAGTSRMARCLPGVAQRLGGRADTHVTGLSVTESRVAINRWYYRQRMEAVLEREHRPWIILLDPGSHSPWRGTTGLAHLELVAVTLDEGSERTRVVGFREPAADARTIRPDAELLFVAGAGWTKKQADGQTHTKEAERLILDFLKLSHSSLGSSKSLVDLSGEGQSVLSFLTHLNQIGQTGSTPRHLKGLATCCHGEEPHTVGWRFVKERRAISLDPNCGWARGKADVLYVADAFAVMARINAALAGQDAV
jgi:electron transfer flavoprotein alpha subunit